MADAPAPSRSRWFTETKDPQLLRQFSELADDSVKSFIGDRVGPVTSTIFILNSLTGLSLLTLPYGFSRAGLALGALILFVCMVMAFVTSTFMCEALSIANALQYEAAEVRKLENDPEVLAKIRKEKEEIVTTISEPLLKERMVKHHNTVDLFVHDNRGCNAEREFKIRERLELGVMGEQVLKGSRGRVWSAMIYATVMIYVLGTATALVVTVNKSLRGTMCSAVDLASNGVHQCDVHSGVIIYKCSVVVTFFLVLPLCFADIQKTKRFTMGIMVVRFIAIACLLLISSWFAGQRIHREGWSAVQGQLPMWNIGEFASVYGNAVFLYGLHQYLPSMVSPLEKQTQAPWVILAAFLIGAAMLRDHPQRVRHSHGGLGRRGARQLLHPSRRPLLPDPGHLQPQLCAREPGARRREPVPGDVPRHGRGQHPHRGDHPAQHHLEVQHGDDPRRAPAALRGGLLHRGRAGRHQVRRRLRGAHHGHLLPGPARLAGPAHAGPERVR
ncbi:unnamed protein product, partial [Prorocentrum cordatum]